VMAGVAAPAIEGPVADGWKFAPGVKRAIKEGGRKNQYVDIAYFNENGLKALQAMYVALRHHIPERIMVSTPPTTTSEFWELYQEATSS